jgi:tetratricopeptide (TPR) repeat protein
MGSFNAAIVEYDKAIAIDPTNFGLYIDRAGVEANNGSTGAAAADDLLALRLAPRQAPSYVSIAYSFSYFQDFADAIKAMDRAIALVPSNPSLYETRAGFYLQIQDAQRAYADYNKALKVAPFTLSRANIYADLASVYQTQQDYSSAFRAIAAAIQLVPDNAHFYVKSGDIHQAAGALDPALKLYSHALKLVSKGSDAEAAHEGKGDVLASLGQPRAAIAEYRIAQRLANKNDGVIQPRLKSKIKALLTGQS